MSETKPTQGKPARRKSDLTLLGSSTQDVEDKVYTLEFGVNLAQITFEGLNNYAVNISCHDKKSGNTESLGAVLEIRLREQNNILSLEGGPPYAFTVGKKTLDLNQMETDQSIIDAVDKGIAWLKGESDDKWIHQNRRRIPETLLADPIAVNLLMSSISTVIGKATACHNEVVSKHSRIFTSRSDYIDAMFDYLKKHIDEMTEIAIHRAVHNLMGSS